MAHWILIVDDEAAMRRMLVEGLRDEGRNASSATGVGEAIGLVESRAFAVVVSDIAMLDGDGFELLGHIRATENPVPVILMSSFGTPETAQRATEAGAFAFLPKPFELVELLELLDRADAASPARG